MLGVLAVALALTSPVPLPRPALESMAAADAVAMAAPAAAAPERPAGRGAVPVPVERPEASGEDGPASAEAAGNTAHGESDAADADETSGATETALGADVDDPAAAPIPLERPALAARGEAAGGTASEAPDEADETDPAAGDVPRPVARPERSPHGEAPGKAADGPPVIKAMLLPGQSLKPGPGNPTAPRDMVCRDPRIVGAPAASFAGGIPGCGVFEPVRVASIAGVGMSAPITVDCRTARAVADWLTGVAQPAARETMNGSIDSLWIMGSYTCRTRNNQPGKRLSEHSAGRAIDLGGVTLANGRRVVVRDDWGKGAAGDFLSRVREGACGGFTTVLGPGSDRYHHNHLHLDTAYRSITYCR